MTTEPADRHPAECPAPAPIPELAVVRLTADVICLDPGAMVLKAGTEGAVISIIGNHEGYMVEFFDTDGETLAIAVCEAGQIERVVPDAPASPAERLAALLVPLTAAEAQAIAIGETYIVLNDYDRPISVLKMSEQRFALIRETGGIRGNMAKHLVRRICRHTPEAERLIAEITADAANRARIAEVSAQLYGADLERALAGLETVVAGRKETANEI